MEINEPIDTGTIARDHAGSWHAQKLATIEGVNLKFRVMRDTAAGFHVHDDSPECFFVVSGTVVIDTEQGSVTLGAGHFFQVAPGVSHRARVAGEATLLVMDRFAG